MEGFHRYIVMKFLGLGNLIKPRILMPTFSSAHGSMLACYFQDKRMNNFSLMPLADKVLVFDLSLKKISLKLFLTQTIMKK